MNSNASQRDADDQISEREARRKARLQARNVLADCSLMLRYAYEEGLTLSEDLRGKIAFVDRYLVARNKDPLSELPASLLFDPGQATIVVAPKEEPEPDVQAKPDEAPPGIQGDPRDPVGARLKTPEITDILLDIHNELSLLVAPATAVSLRATDPDLVWHGVPGIVWITMLIAVCCIGGLATQLENNAKAAVNDQQPDNSSSATKASSPAGDAARYPTPK